MYKLYGERLALGSSMALIVLEWEMKRKNKFSEGDNAIDVWWYFFSVMVSVWAKNMVEIVDGSYSHKPRDKNVSEFFIAVVIN